MKTLRYNPPSEWTNSSANYLFLGFCDMLSYINSYFKGRNDLRMIEIGSFMGESSSLFASSGMFKEIHCIEPFSGKEEAFDTLPIDTWRDIYKLFVHPAGMYVAGEVQIVSIAEPDYLLMPPGIADSTGPQFTGIAEAAMFGFNATNHIVQDLGSQPEPFTLAPIQLGQLQGGMMTLAEFDNNFDTLAEGANAGSQTFDEDSVVGDSSYPRMSSNNQLLLNFSNDFF